MKPRRDTLDALVQAAREAEGPTAADRARIREALMAKIAPPPTAPPVPPTLVAPAIGGITAVVVAVALEALAPHRAPSPRRPIAAVAPARPSAPSMQPPAPRSVQTPAAPPPRSVPLPLAVTRRRSRVIPAATVAPSEIPPESPTPSPAAEVAAAAPSPGSPPAPPPRPNAAHGHGDATDASAALPPDLLVLAEARALLRAGDARGALGRLERFAEEHPDAPRAVERAGARLIARCAEGLAGAREVSEYLSRHGGSPLAAGVRDRCAAVIAPR